jgi:hypothetical protein
MTPTEERYRDYAFQCIGVAQQITDPVDKAVMLQMAESWLRLADRAAANNSSGDCPK